MPVPTPAQTRQRLAENIEVVRTDEQMQEAIRNGAAAMLYALLQSKGAKPMTLMKARQIVDLMEAYEVIRIVKP